MAHRFLVVAALLVALAVAVAAAGPQQESADGAGAASKPARIAFVDVGQGDGVVMKVGSAVVVSDAGEVNPENIEAQLRAFGRTRTIDVAILSHPHDDHVKDFIRLLEHGWRIKLAVRSDSAHWQGTNTNRQLMRLLAARNVPVELAAAGMTFSWGGARWEILNPPTGKYTGGAAQAGNASIAYLLTINSVRALFTGDVEPKVGRAIARTLETRLQRPIDIFLATHHGSKHGSVQELVDATRPRWAVVSVGAGNTYGHPAPEATARLEAAGATIWCTDTNGTVTARISTHGRLSWRASRQVAPWWSGRDHVANGTCAGHPR